MNDPIKDFIEEKRAEFDHLEAPAFDLKKFKAKVADQQVVEKPVFKLKPGPKWLAAASVVLVVAAFLVYSSGQDANISGQRTARSTALDDKGSEVNDKSSVKDLQAKDGLNVADESSDQVIKGVQHMAIALSKPGNQNKARATKAVTGAGSADRVYQNLADSSSSSTRLAAILEIKKTGTMSNYVIDRLTSTLNNDNNSNVRLAALGILSNYSKDQYVSSLLVSSLNTQKDPMVQLELLNLLGTMEHVKIEDKLYALTADPNTFGAVKEEAYNILLNQNRL
jgi:hypothetical protein